MFKPLSMAALVVAAVAVTGCAGSGKRDASDASTTTTPISTTPTTMPSTSSASAYAPDLSTSVVYFEFDSTELSSQSLAVIAQFGKYLASNPSSTIRLEGHADERGTREYNIGLGERRALAVAGALMSAGAVQGQISVVSYGEERPSAAGHDESSWSLNRRVELVVL